MNDQYLFIIVPTLVIAWVYWQRRKTAQAVLKAAREPIEKLEPVAAAAIAALEGARDTASKPNGPPESVNAYREAVVHAADTERRLYLGVRAHNHGSWARTATRLRDEIKHLESNRTIDDHRLLLNILEHRRYGGSADVEKELCTARKEELRKSGEQIAMLAVLVRALD
jgi:hypothetical protein